LALKSLGRNPGLCVNIPLWPVIGSRLIVLIVSSRSFHGLLADAFETGGKSRRTRAVHASEE